MEERKRKRKRKMFIEQLIIQTIYMTLILLCICNIYHIYEETKYREETTKKINNLSKEITTSEQVIKVDKKVAEIEQNTPRNANCLDDYTRDYIERVVAAEARGETYQEMCAVAQTIKDRSDLWNKTPLEIISAENQYAKPIQDEASEEIKLAVSEVFDNGYRVFEEPTTHFHNDTVSPSWADLKACRGKINRTSFYY